MNVRSMILPKGFSKNSWEKCLQPTDEQGRRNWGGQGSTCPPRFLQFSTKIVLLRPLRILDLESILLRAPQNFRPSYGSHKGHFFSGDSALTNRPDANTQLSPIFLKIWTFKG